MIQAIPAPVRLEEGRGARAQTTAATNVYWGKGDLIPTPVFAATKYGFVTAPVLFHIIEK
jgi:hypothetical protein